MPSPTVPYGQRLVISVIDQYADNGHQRPYCLLPKSQDPAQGFYPVYYPQLRNAIDRAAHFLDNLYDSASSTTFAWMGPATDFRYLLLAYAAMKTGHIVFLPSPRNSIDAHLALLDTTGVSAILQPADAEMPVIKAIRDHRPLPLANMPPLDHFLADNAPTTPYSFTKSFDEARLTPCMILHTSGSTGIPKPVTIRHAWFSVSDASHDLPALGAAEHGLTHMQGSTLFAPFPNFHSAGLLFKLAVSVFWDIVVVSTPNAPLTADLADACHVHAKVDASMLPTSVLRGLTQNQRYLDNLENIQYIGFGGSPLAADVGNILQRRTHVLSMFGITETSLSPFEKTDHDDWDYSKFSPHTGIEFRHVSDGQYEMVYVRKPHLERFQGIFVTEPDATEWHTKDLWSKHPTKPDLWHYEARLDDIIVFSNGEKLNPTTMEQTIEAHPLLAGALVGGAGRFQSCLLVEPHPNTDLDANRLRDRIWPIVQEANAAAVAHGRISKDLILVSPPDKQFIRTDKGSIKRKMTNTAHDEEIKALYDRYDAGGMAPESAALDLTNSETAKSSLLSVIKRNTDITALTDDQDFFSTGMDSLQASNISRALNQASSGKLKLQPRDIYSHATLNLLAAFITSSQQGPAMSSAAPPPQTREAQMSELLSILSSDLPINARAISLPAPAVPKCVLLTGSTGSLGSYLLDGLLRDRAISRVFCLNRSSDANDRQMAAHKSRGLTTDLSRATFVLAKDLSAPYLSVEESTYREMLSGVTHVIHNAWPVNFNRSLASFDSHVRGTRRMVDFCCHSAHGASLCFLGTIASASNWRGNKGEKVPEQIFEDWNISQSLGYASSKHVAEVLLDAAARRSGVSTTVMRLGQVAGPVTHGSQGMWNKAEWLPSLVASSKQLGKVPDSLGGMQLVDWMPVDLLAEAILQVVQTPSVAQSGRRGAKVRHFVNPSAAAWKDLLPAVKGGVSAAKGLEVVSLADWVSALQASAADNDLEANSALKLLPFFEQLATPDSGEMSVLDVRNCVAESSALRDMKAVNGDWMKMWIQQWGF